MHLYHDRLACFLGATLVTTLKRIYPTGKTTRARNIDYRHVIHSLIKKPQAFRFSSIRDDLLPNEDYKQIWQFIDKHESGLFACRLMVGILYLAATADCEKALSQAVLWLIKEGRPINLACLERRFAKEIKTDVPRLCVFQHDLTAYNQFVGNEEESYA